MTAAAELELGQLQLLDLTNIEISALNPRRDVGDLTELAASIEQVGVLEPIVVVQRNGHYEAITGSRRTAASKLAGRKQIPARIMSLTEADQAAAALIENLQRKDLTPLEEAEAFQKYLQLTGVTQKELGQRIGRAPSTIANALRLLEAPKPIKALLTKGEIDAAHTREFLKLVDPGLAEQAIKVARSFVRNERDGHENGRVTVSDVVEAVERVNAAHHEKLVLSTLKPDLKAKKDELEAKGKIVTWAPVQKYGAYDAEWQVAKYLGAPPKKIVTAFDSYEGSNWKSHEKDCGCESVELTLGGNYGADAHKITTRRVCTNTSAFNKWRRKTGRSEGTNRQQRAAQRRVDPQKEIARYEREWRLRDARIARSTEAKKVLGKGRLTPDHLRLMVLGYVSPDSPGLLAKVEKMTGLQLERFLVADLAENYTSDRYRGQVETQHAFAIKTFGLDWKVLGFKERTVASSSFGIIPPSTEADPKKKAKRA